MVKIALSLLEDKEKQKDLQTNIGQLAKPNAAETIANEVIALCATKPTMP